MGAEGAVRRVERYRLLSQHDEYLKSERQLKSEMIEGEMKSNQNKLNWVVESSYW